MANPKRIQQSAGGVSILMDDGTRLLARKLSSGQWAVNTPPEPDPEPKPPKPKPPPSGGGGGTWRWPFPRSAIFNDWGPRAGGFHFGIDFGYAPAVNNAPIYAIGPGTVIGSGWDPIGWIQSGYAVSVDHGTIAGDRWYSHYFHMIGNPPVKVGDKVDTKTMIGRIGTTGLSTGPHLHLQITKNAQIGLAGPSVHPKIFLDARGAKGG